MLSGIGDPAELRSPRHRGKSAARAASARICRITSRPTSVTSARRRGNFHREMRLDRILRELARAYLFGRASRATCPAASRPSSRPASIPNCPTYNSCSAPDRWPRSRILPPFLPSFADTFGCRVALLRPKSRGEFRSRPPIRARRCASPELSSATDDDLKVLRAGMRMARDVGRQTPMAPFIGTEDAPARTPMPRSTRISVRPASPSITRSAPAAWAATRDLSSIRNCACAASTRLRVVDASVMPDLDRRQHQRCGDHDRREGRRHDPRPGRAAARQRVTSSSRQRRPSLQDADHHRTHLAGRDLRPSSARRHPPGRLCADAGQAG